jgi:HEAT repeat protein
MLPKNLVLLPAIACAMLFAVSSACAQDEVPQQGPPANNPIVVKPTTVAGNFDAALLTLKLARTDLAKYYLEQLLALNPTDEDLLELRKQHGTGTFLELAGVEGLNPPATELLDRLNEVIRRQVSEPGYADKLIRQLSGSAREQSQALRELQHLGPQAVPPILMHLNGDLGTGAEILLTTLTRLGPETVPPLLGALQSPDPTVRATAADVIGRIGSPADILWLWFPAFGPGQPDGVQLAARTAIARLRYGNDAPISRISSDGAPRTLLTAATELLTGRYPWPELFKDLDQIPVWIWSADAGTVIEQPVSRPLAGIYFAEILARQASLLAPSSEQAPVILLAALFMRDREQAEWKTGLPTGPGTVLDAAVACGPETCVRVLQYGLDQKLVAVSLGALEALALNGSPDLLHKGPGRSPVLDALDAPNSRVEFSAATTILHWEPTKSFTGSRRVVEILARAINSEPSAATVVIDPNQSRAGTTAGLFSELGFRPYLARTGQDGFLIAARTGNIELAVLHPNVIRWNLSQTLANLRADARTANLPVVIYGPASIRDEMQRYSAEFQHVVYIDEATSARQVQPSLQRVLAMQSPPTLTAEQRTQQISEAAFWLRRIAIRNLPEVFDLVPAQAALMGATRNPAIAEDALIALGVIGRAEVQRELANLAVSPAIDSKIRQLAATQLAFHIQQFGELLNKMELQAIQAAWQAEADPNLHLALSGVLGTLKPTVTAARKEILALPGSSGPVNVVAPPQPGLQ